jgi:hypothetical protein
MTIEHENRPGKWPTPRHPSPLLPGPCAKAFDVHAIDALLVIAQPVTV